MAVRKRAAVRSALNYLRFADEVVILQNRADLNVETRPRAWRVSRASRCGEHAYGLGRRRQHCEVADRGRASPSSCRI